VPRIDLCSYKLLGSFGLGLAFCPELFPLAFRIRTLPRVGKCLNSQFGSVPHWLYTTDVPSRQAGYTRKRISLMYLKSIILLDMVRRGGYGWSSSLISEERRRFCRGRKGLKKPAFCETKPFVMCGKQGISSCCERRWKHYRKMTNGFVFLILGVCRGEFANQTSGSKCMMKIRSFSFAPLDGAHIIR